ncbi:hypothetical protein [Streptomyces sp. NPDC005533]|uniref:hypothetical protein n=1 Tax=Streptomyces sp. NPDC005533 TaxID=3364723 RepID=UPI0036C69341
MRPFGIGLCVARALSSRLTAEVRRAGARWVLAFLNRRMDISLTDERTPGRSRPVWFHSPGGARDFVAFLDETRGTPVTSAPSDVIGLEWEDARWCDSGQEHVVGFANSERTPDGDTHVEGYRDGVAAA